MKRAIVLLTAAAAVVAVATLDAHKPITSKYTFWEDVYPIVKEHCGGCHVAGGIAPMSLMTYEDARPWAESIRLELTSGHMPPWYGDPGAAPLRDVHKLSPRDLDVVLTWVTGGTPPGPPAKVAAVSARRTWQKGRPDLLVPVSAAVTLPADKNEETREFVLREDNDRDRAIAFADVLPSNPSIVHDAIIFSRKPGDPEVTVIAMWLPGLAPVSAPSGSGFVWRAHEELVARIHYKKNWKLENKSATDHSAIGLYWTKSASWRAIRGIPVSPAGPEPIADHLQAVAVRVSAASGETPIRVDAVRPDGTRLTLAGFVARAGWNERYWLARPVDLPKGTRVEMNRAVSDVQIWVDASEM
jgi:mono/diheme cytochrome c family protein